MLRRVALANTEVTEERVTVKMIFRDTSRVPSHILVFRYTQDSPCSMYHSHVLCLLHVLPTAIVREIFPAMDSHVTNIVRMEFYRLLGCDAVRPFLDLIIRWKFSPPSSG
jgi:hypothetical protein